MHQPATAASGAGRTGRWRRHSFYYAGGLALTAVGALLGLVGLLKVQAAEYPLNVELRQGCLANPSMVAPGAPCPQRAQATLHYPHGRTRVLTGTPQQVQRRVAEATDRVVTAQRWQGVGYILVASLLVGSGIAAIARQLLRRGPRRPIPLDRPGGHGASSPTE